MATLPQLKTLFQPLKTLTVPERTVTIQGINVTLGPVPASLSLWVSEPMEEYRMVVLPQVQNLATASTEEQMELVSQFRQVDQETMFRTLAGSVVALGDLDFRDQAYIETGETTLEGQNIRVPRHEALYTLIKDLHISVCNALYKEYGELEAEMEKKLVEKVSIPPFDYETDKTRLEGQLKTLTRDPHTPERSAQVPPTMPAPAKPAQVPEPVRSEEPTDERTPEELEVYLASLRANRPVLNADGPRPAPPHAAAAALDFDGTPAPVRQPVPLSGGNKNPRFKSR